MRINPQAVPHNGAIYLVPDLFACPPMSNCISQRAPLWYTARNICAEITLINAMNNLMCGATTYQGASF